MKAIDALSVNSIRVLAADAIQKANSDIQACPLGSAPMAYELWANHMNHNPANPKWENRGPLHPFRRPWLHASVFPFYTCSDTGLPRRIS